MNKKMMLGGLIVVAIIMIIIGIVLNNQPKKYTITFDTNGGNVIEKVEVKEGTKIAALEKPVRKGYKFLYWTYKGEICKDNDVIKENMTLIATWKANESTKIKTYTVSFDTDGGNEIEDQIIEEGNVIIKPDAPEKEGYTFMYWELDGKTYNFSEKVTKDMTLKAKWKKIVKYTVTFDSNGGSAVESQEVEEGQKAKKPTAPTREGYTFVEWKLDGKAYDFSKKVTKDIKLVAEWKKNENKPSEPSTPSEPSKPSTPSTPSEPTKNKYTVTFDSNGGSKVSSQTVTEGSKAKKPANPTRSGYTFVEWTLNGKTYDFSSKVTKNITLVAKWKEVAKKYTVTFDSNGGSAVASQTITEGSKVTKPANPTRSGYTFVEWTLNGKTYDFSSKVTKNITLVAQWKEVVKNKYTVTFDSNGGSAVASQTITEGSKATRPGDPTREGYNFAGWTLNGVNYDFNAPVQGNITLVAQWNQKNYSVVANSVDPMTPFSKTLTVYEDGQVITVKEIQYSDGLFICYGTSPNVNQSALTGETTLRLVLTGGTVVTASLTIN